MNNKCTLYIDEAGDLGFNRGTQWFVLSGVIVEKNDEPLIRNIMKNIKNKLNMNNIHFRNMKYEQKAYVVDTLCQGRFKFISIIVDTTKITLKTKNKDDKPSFITYNFACRLLLERASWYLRDNKMIADIVLSSRGTSRDGELIEYIREKLLNYDYNQVSNVFHKITAKPAASWDMLQLADVCATSMFYFYEPNRFGLVAPCFIYRMLPFIYSHNQERKNYGVKYYAEEMRPDNNYLKNKTICKKI